MKTNSLEELITNSNIAGELRNYTDWHTRLVKFAQLVADWQKEQIFKDAEETELYWDGDFLAIDLNMAALGYSERDKVRIVVLKEEEE